MYRDHCVITSQNACASALVAAELPKWLLLEALRKRAALVEHADGVYSLTLACVRVAALKHLRGAWRHVSSPCDREILTCRRIGGMYAHMTKMRATIVAADLGTRAHADVRTAV